MAASGAKIGRYFYIKNEQNDLVLDAGKKSGAAIVTNTQDPEDQGQLWYIDEPTGTIRNKDNDLCIETKGSKVILSKFKANDGDQQWKLSDNKLHHRLNPNRVLAIDGGSEEPGATIAPVQFQHRPDQKWKLEQAPVEYFYIKSALNGKVLDIQGEPTEPDKEVAMYHKKGFGSDDQVWYEGQDGVIRTKLSGFALGTSEGEPLKTVVYDPENVDHQWVIGMKDKMIQNKQDASRVLEVEDGNKDDGAKVTATEYKKKKWQHWEFVVV